jgi:hypothetical protein
MTPNEKSSYIMDVCVFFNGQITLTNYQPSMRCDQSIIEESIYIVPSARFSPLLAQYVQTAAINS